MPLTTYEEVRPWSRAIKTRTGLGARAGVMPPWFVEKNIGIQKFKDDPSLSDEEIATDREVGRQRRAARQPRRHAAAARFRERATSGRSASRTSCCGPRKSSCRRPVPTSGARSGWCRPALTEDRYVSAVEVREINDIPKSGPTNTVGGRYVWHHMTYSSEVPGAAADAARTGTAEAGNAGGGTSWPIHEVGRNADVFPPEAGRLLAANSSLNLSAYHLHSNGRETKAHLEFGFKFFPKGYQPKYRRSTLRLGNGVDMDVKPNTANQELHSYAVLQEHTKIIAFEPHLHAPGVRMCLEAIWGQNIITLNCVGYDHNWVKQYVYDDASAPLLPKGTIVHLIGFLDTTPANKNPADPRNWAGGGRRSIANMFIDLGYSVSLTEEQFQEEMEKRRQNMKSRNEFDIGCPLCWAPALPKTQTTAGAQNQQ